MNTENQQRNPVLLIHGIDDTEAVFRQMRPYLIQQRFTVHALNLVPNNGDVGLDELAKQVADYVTANFGSEQPLDLVGFSMGGIVSRYYVQRLGGINRVQRFITISSPHHGTVVAYGSRRPGCVQMRPDSLFLKDLNSDAVILKQLNFTSIWTPYDLMIVPTNSSQMPVGQQVIVPVALHPWMLTDSRSLAAVTAALAEPIKLPLLKKKSSQ
ncbi:MULTISPECIES: triacylglycerol lipase [Nostoc]|uniref:Triacylglycerol lipase n=1 Tax=Nostoc paludosum FACHB-159 TaxID=2692908 RepID=A0ABR8KCH5_9NOSO|nr:MULTISPECIES: triacylglycerol lipase [Nostoc]MBD2680672.1 triacylglycerol lipase [Nostoc sp. FACHB-857]MBD2737225.1 triacylglycerol lipase [Nostoc paludosum FACHB-159]MDZ8104525.1 triacylglycerol lipase [Nostoc sp. DedQUE12a]